MTMVRVPAQYERKAILSKLSEGLRLALCVLSLGACTRVTMPNPSAARDSRALRLPLGSEPPVMDPQLADTAASLFALKQITSTLLRYNETASERGDLTAGDASAYLWSKDGRQLELQIRNDLRWSDGEPLVACHYRDALMRALDPAVPAALAELLYPIRGAAERKSGRAAESAVGIRCDNAKSQLVIETTQARPQNLLHALAFAISSPLRVDLFKKYAEGWMQPHCAGGANAQNAAACRCGISSGAYCLAEWKHDQRVVLRSRVAMGEADLPADRRAQIATIYMPIVRDPATAYSLFQSGEVDAVDELPPVMVPTLIRRPDHVASAIATTYMVGFSLTANPVLRDARVRRALALTAHAGEVPGLLGGGEMAARGWVPPALLPTAVVVGGDAAAAASADPNMLRFDPAQARSLLAQAGYARGKNFPRLKLMYNAGERHQLLMERLANNWRTHLGVRVDLEPREWKVLVTQLKALAPDLYRYAWTAVYPDPLFFLQLFRSGSPNNFGRWRNARYDAVLDKLEAWGARPRDQDFWKLVHEAENILVVQDPALVPVYHYVKHALIRPNVRGLNYGGQGLPLLRDVRKE